MEQKYKYFIEDTETWLWYRNTLHLQPTEHTFCKGWDKPDLLPREYWTRDPIQALSFGSQREALEFLGKMISFGSLQFMADKYAELKHLAITEHEFVDKKQVG